MKDSIFEANPKLDCYFETSDGTPFYTDYAADTHAKSLEHKLVKTIYRSNEVEPVEEKTEATHPVESIAPVEETTEPTTKNKK